MPFSIKFIFKMWNITLAQKIDQDSNSADFRKFHSISATLKVISMNMVQKIIDLDINVAYNLCGHSRLGFEYIPSKFYYWVLCKDWYFPLRPYGRVLEKERGIGRSTYDWKLNSQVIWWFSYPSTLLSQNLKTVLVFKFQTLERPLLII